MAGKSFALIDSGILSNRNFRALSGAAPRSAYFTLHLCSQANYLGLFRYPLAYFSHDTGMPEASLLNAVHELQERQLIEYDEDEEIVRIVGWYFGQNCPNNKSRVISVGREYASSQVSACPITYASIAEFCVGVLKEINNILQRSDHGIEMLLSLRDFLDIITKQFPDVADRLAQEMRSHGAGISNDCMKAIAKFLPTDFVGREYPHLMVQDTLPAPSAHRQSKVVAYENRKKQNKKNKPPVKRDSSPSEEGKISWSISPLPETLRTPLVQRSKL